MWFAELLIEVYIIIEDLQFWKRKRARRKYEKEHGLPKKLMWLYPSQKIYIIAIFILIIVLSLIILIFFRNINEDRTKNKLIGISKILEQEKKSIGAYPKDLKTIIRNSPLRKNITEDDWGNELQYILSENSETYILFSSGKDGIPNTKDDIKLNI